MRAAGMPGVSCRKRPLMGMRQARTRPAPDLVQRNFSMAALIRLCAAYLLTPALQLQVSLTSQRGQGAFFLLWSWTP